MRRLWVFLVGLAVGACLAVSPRSSNAQSVDDVRVAAIAKESVAGHFGVKQGSRKSNTARAAKPMPIPPDEPRRQPVAYAPPRALVADEVLVMKSERRLYLLWQGRPVRAYDVALGFNPIGHKLHEGDGRTPEGVYTLGEALPESRFYRALPISYPAPDDVERARSLGLRPGGRIMIHGLPPSGARMGRQHLYLDWTDGCVAVTNEEIDEIAQAIRPGTRIEIRP